MSESTNPTSKNIDPMYPHSGFFVLSKNNPEYPSFADNVYLLMRGFNAIKISGPISNAQVMIKWNLHRQYSTDLWSYENEIDDTLVFPFKDNNGTITFEGKAKKTDASWEAKLGFEFINLTQEEINELMDESS